MPADPNSGCPRPIIIDTDPGQDDAFAILLALAAPELEVLGLTTVGGNAPLARTTDNARRIVELAGQPEVPVHAGAQDPLLRPAEHAESVHGKTGIDGYDWPEAAHPPALGFAVDWIIKAVKARAPQKTTLVALGPQTNIALALKMAPELTRHIERIVYMGGGYFTGGNWSPAAEYNILVDPEAAAIVLGSGVPVTAVPLDCTHSAPTPIGWADRLDALGTNTGAAAAGMLRFFERYGNQKYGTPSRPLHDALAIGWLLWPELFEGRECHVDIELAGTLTAGMTVVDYWHVTGKPKNCLWTTGCDAGTLYTRMEAALARLP